MKIDTNGDMQCVQSGAGDLSIGVSGPSIRQQGDTYAAISGDSCLVFTAGAICLLQANSAGFTHGDKLKPTSTGTAVTTTTGNDVYSAIALETVPANALGRVFVTVGVKV